MSDSETKTATSAIIDNVASIVTAYVSRNTISISDVGTVIRTVHDALASLDKPVASAAPAPLPAVPVKRSVLEDAIVCLECGERHKMLKRHLSTAHGISIDEYRTRWSLSSDYPMVAPAYSKVRSQMAKARGFGRKR